MLDLVSRWKQSGQTQGQFAAEHDLKLSKLRYWIYKARNNGIMDTPFIELGTQAEVGIQVRFPNGVELSLPTGMPVSEIKKLIQWQG